MKIVASALMLALLSGCAAVGGDKLPKSLGEQSASYGYIPLDPLPIKTAEFAGSCTSSNSYKPLLEALPDISVRFAVAELSSGGQLQFGPALVTSKGTAYRAVLDYINSDSVTLNFLVRKRIMRSGKPQWVPVSEEIDFSAQERVIAYEARVIPYQPSGEEVKDYIDLPSGFLPTGVRKPEVSQTASDENDGWERIAFPIYIGLGLRLTADIRALEGGIALSGLTAIGAKADAKGLTGTMTLQSLGINGLPTTTVLTLPSKLDQTSVEQSILAIGTGRAVIYTDSEKNKVTLSPRVVGLYSPVGSDPRLINAVYSELSTIRVPWPRPCIGDK
jgi:hypothetical protein